MKELLAELLKKIVTQPAKVKVSEEENLLVISADPSDLGVIIGKEGRNIKALRTLLNLKGAKQGAPRFELKVNAESE